MDKHFSNAQRAEVLTQALPYIKNYNGKILVVKYGGNAMINQTLKEQVMEDIAIRKAVDFVVENAKEAKPAAKKSTTKKAKEAKAEEAEAETTEEA